MRMRAVTASKINHTGYHQIRRRHQLRILKESVFKFAHPLLFASKVNSAIQAKVLVSVVLFSGKGV